MILESQGYWRTAMCLLGAAVGAYACGGSASDTGVRMSSGDEPAAEAEHEAGAATSGAEAPSGAPCEVACTDDTSARPVPEARPQCPVQEPAVGTECGVRGLVCGYGDSPRAECRRVLECSDVWQVPEWLSHLVCIDDESIGCPEASPNHGEECDLALRDTPCFYGVNQCSCRAGAWFCHGPPEDPRCPAILPNLGEGCDEVGVACAYAIDGCVGTPISNLYCFNGEDGPEWERGAGLGCAF